MPFFDHSFCTQTCAALYLLQFLAANTALDSPFRLGDWTLIPKLPNYQVTQLPNFHLQQACLNRNQNKILVTNGITA